MIGRWTFRQPRRDWLLWAFVLGHGALIVSLTIGTWVTGADVFLDYTSAAASGDYIGDANRVFWAKDCFLFLTVLLLASGLGSRAAVGFGAVFWSVALMVIFSVDLLLMATLILGLALIGSKGPSNRDRTGRLRRPRSGAHQT